jgi:hypothetical protein
MKRVYFNRRRRASGRLRFQVLFPSQAAERSATSGVRTPLRPHLAPSLQKEG